MVIESGKRIIVAVNLEPCLCKAGDKGTILELRYAVPNVPRAWDVVLDTGRRLYLYEDEFALDEQNPIRSPNISLPNVW